MTEASEDSAEKRPLPAGGQADDLRGVLAIAYVRAITLAAPPSQVSAGLFRQLGGLPVRARRFVQSALHAMLRRRIRTVRLAQWAGRAAPAFPWPADRVLPTESDPPGEAIWALLRWLVEDLETEPAEAAGIAHAALMAAVARGEAWEIPGPESLARVAESIREDGGLRGAPADVQLSARVSLTPPLLARWQARWGTDGAAAIATAFQQPAPLDVRVNLARTDVPKAIASLAAAEVAAEPTPFSPDGLRLAKKVALQELKAAKEGWIEVQGEGSQLVCHAVAPKHWMKILDACAGGGGKTLHLASLLLGKGLVYALDSDEKRLKEAGSRAAKLNLSNVRMLPVDGWPPKPVDMVLIDAPCLGFGTLRSAPELQWRGELPDRIAETTALQRDVLTTYARAVRHKGWLVYATCSFEPEETTEMIEWFLASNPEFRPDPLPELFHRPEFAAHTTFDGAAVTVLPHVHGTEGFFIARLRRDV